MFCKVTLGVLKGASKLNVLLYYYYHTNTVVIMGVRANSAFLTPVCHEEDVNHSTINDINSPRVLERRWS